MQRRDAIWRSGWKKGQREGKQQAARDPHRAKRTSYQIWGRTTATTTTTTTAPTSDSTQRHTCRRKQAAQVGFRQPSLSTAFVIKMRPSKRTALPWVLAAGAANCAAVTSQGCYIRMAIQFPWLRVVIAPAAGLSGGFCCQPAAARCWRDTHCQGQRASDRGPGGGSSSIM